MDTALIDKLLGGSYGSRKFLMALLAIVVLGTTGILSVWYPAAKDALTPLATGLVAVLGVYFTSNVASKFVATKAINASEATAAESKSNTEINTGKTQNASELVAATSKSNTEINTAEGEV